MKYCFDPECFELAQYFFPAASEARLNEIAQCVQDTIEGFSDMESTQFESWRNRTAAEIATEMPGYDANGAPVETNGDRS